MMLGFTTMTTPELSGVESIKVAKKYGYGSVALRLSENRGNLDLSSENNKIKEIKDAYKSEGIIPGALLCYNPHIKVADEIESKTVPYLVKAMEIAANIGCKNIRVFVDGNLIEQYAESFLAALDKSKAGVGIVIQNHKNWSDHNDIVKLIEYAKSSLIGLLYSPDHIADNNLVVSETKKVKSYTKEIYAIDKISYDDGQGEHKLFGQGQMDWESLYKELDINNFDGIVSVKWEKIWHPELADYSVVLPFCKDWFDRMQNR